MRAGRFACVAGLFCVAVGPLVSVTISYNSIVLCIYNAFLQAFGQPKLFLFFSIFF
jgi:hypothetical protein